MVDPAFHIDLAYRKYLLMISQFCVTKCVDVFNVHEHLGLDSKYACLVEGFILFQGVRFMLSITYFYVVG
jgi:hypothetical protein